MNLLISAQHAYIIISLVSIPLIFFPLLPHIFPSNLSGIAPNVKLSTPSISLAMWTMLRCGISLLDRYVLKKGGDLFCSIDAMVVATLTTGMVAHLPAIALFRYKSLPTPSNPFPTNPTKGRTIICLMTIYAYSLLPCVPTLSNAISRHFDSPDGIVKWWGFYCIDKGDWFSTVRPITLLIPLGMTLPITILILSLLYSTSGHPSPHIHPTINNWLQGIILLLISSGIGGFVICERLVGWNDRWWLRSFEALAGPMLALCFLTDKNIYITYSHWILLRRPPKSEPLENTSPLLPTSDEKSLNRSSSFFVPRITGTRSRLVPKRSVRFPPTPQQAEYIPNRQTLDSTRSESVFGRGSLLPPPAKLRTKLSKPNTELRLNLEELYPSPCIDVSRSESTSGCQNEMEIPDVIIQQPTPIHMSQDGYKYSISASKSSPFRHHDFDTIHSVNTNVAFPSHSPPRCRRESVNRNTDINSPVTYTTYTQASEPFDDRYNELISTAESGFDTDIFPQNRPGRRASRKSTSTSTSSGPGIGEMISTIGQYPITRSFTPATTSTSASSKSRPLTETSSIYSQPSLIESSHAHQHINRTPHVLRPALAYRRNTSDYRYTPSNLMFTAPEENAEEELISFHLESSSKNDYEYGHELEGSSNLV
ncbi:uncharacterized protein IL334_006092 [Kwoniella shivajii]|uniref:Glucose receptor Git3 N-terminal domain-containing protein n=1 Tax=Kwoniella shivajii TaxID=564305 RepID=A0ABZ1D5A3_9TREE|nr:hypothetical protein IL334_006092 [Kwoniella shivajii]